MARQPSIARHLVDQAEKLPKGDAVFVPRGTLASGEIDYLALDYRGLEQETAAWAAKLQAAGIREGMRTLVLVRPGLPLIATAFALFRLGAVPVLIDPGMGLRSFLACVARTQPEALVGIPLAHLLRFFFRGTFRAVRHKVRVPGKLDYRLHGTGASPMGSGELLAEVAPEATAAILFTSGSTGMPKGVVYSHAHFEAQIRLVRDTYDIRSGEVDMTLLPIFALFNPALGMATVVPEVDPRRPASLDPARVVRAIHQRSVTNAFGAPPLWRRIADHCETHGLDLAPMRRILLAGAPVPPPLIERLHRLLPAGEIHTPYGATECLPVASASGREILAATASQHAVAGGVCVGKPVEGVSIAVVGPADGPLSQPRPLAAGEIGEVLVSGPIVTEAYDRLPEPTAEAKVRWAGPQPAATARLWHRMGDLGRLDAEGRLWFLGRKAERVTVAGGFLLSEQVEPVFNAHPDVQRCALIQAPGKAGPAAAIVVEPRAGCFPSDDAARRRFTASLGVLRRPEGREAAVTLVYFLRMLPVDVRHNAKIHRLTLARKAHSGKLGPAVAFAEVA